MLNITWIEYYFYYFTNLFGALKGDPNLLETLETIHEWIIELEDAQSKVYDNLPANQKLIHEAICMVRFGKLDDNIHSVNLVREVYKYCEQNMPLHVCRHIKMRYPNVIDELD